MPRRRSKPYENFGIFLLIIEKQGGNRNGSVLEQEGKPNKSKNKKKPKAGGAKGMEKEHLQKLSRGGIDGYTIEMIGTAVTDFLACSLLHAYLVS